MRQIKLNDKFQTMYIDILLKRHSNSYTHTHTHTHTHTQAHASSNKFSTPCEICVSTPCATLTPPLANRVFPPLASHYTPPLAYRVFPPLASHYTPILFTTTTNLTITTIISHVLNTFHTHNHYQLSR
jgi:hypothetical protein